FFTPPPTTDIYTLSLHDALPIWNDPDYAFVDAYAQPAVDRSASNGFRCIRALGPEPNQASLTRTLQLPFRDYRTEKPVSDELFGDRKSTRLNSSHDQISYAVFCL